MLDGAQQLLGGLGEGPIVELTTAPAVGATYGIRFAVQSPPP